MKTIEQLPDDPDALKSVVMQLTLALEEEQLRRAEQLQQLRRLDARIATMQAAPQPAPDPSLEKVQAENTARLAEKEKLIAEMQYALQLEQEKRAAVEASNKDLAWELSLLKHKLFGRKTERFTPNQLDIPGLYPEVETPADPAADEKKEPTEEAADEKKEPKKKPSKKAPKHPHRHGRRDLSQTPPDKTIHPPAPDCCPVCQKALTCIGQAVSRRIDWVPGRHEVIETRLDKCVCPDHPSEGVMTAPEPPFALPKALCGDGLLAKVLTDRAADHIPLSRQVKRFAREGLNISVSTLCDWVIAAAALFVPVIKAMMGALLKGSWIQTDATGAPVLEGDSNTPHHGHMWVYANDVHAVFRYTHNGKGTNTRDELAGYKGVILADGSSVFALVTRTEDCPRAGCWSHARRYIFEARHHDPRAASHILLTIGELFKLEAQLKGKSREARLAGRQEIAKPLLEGLRPYLAQCQRVHDPSTPFWKAIQYIENQWGRLTTFLIHPDVPIHNNGSELQLRQEVVGRKNWMFFGSEGGAEAWAVFYSLVGSCILQGVDPWVYFRDVLPKLSTWPINQIWGLTPAGFKARKVAEAAAG